LKVPILFTLGFDDWELLGISKRELKVWGLVGVSPQLLEFWISKRELKVHEPGLVYKAVICLGISKRELKVRNTASWQLKHFHWISKRELKAVIAVPSAISMKRISKRELKVSHNCQIFSVCSTTGISKRELKVIQTEDLETITLSPENLKKRIESEGLITQADFYRELGIS